MTRGRLTLPASKQLLATLDDLAEAWGVERTQLGAVALAVGLRALAGTGRVPEGIPRAPLGTALHPEGIPRAPLGMARPSLLMSGLMMKTSGRPDDDLAHADEDQEEDGSQEEPPPSGAKRSRLERAVDAAIEQQKAKGARIRSERAYRASIRKQLEGDPERVERLLAEGPSEQPTRPGWSFGRDPV